MLAVGADNQNCNCAPLFVPRLQTEILAFTKENFSSFVFKACIYSRIFREKKISFLFKLKAILFYLACFLYQYFYFLQIKRKKKQTNKNNNKPHV
jgi:Ca2+/Na+ antiporter